jgi:hypothetical protein
MADLNALIAQGAQFQAPIDPFAQYGKMQQLQQGQQANQLNQMKMEEMQAATAERNALRQLNPTSPDYESQLSRVNPQLGIAYRKEAAAAAAQSATQKAQQAQALKTSLDNHRSFLVGVNDQPSYDAWRALTTKNIPELADMLPTAFSPDAKNLLLQTADDISKKLNTPPAVSNLAKLQKELAALPPGDPMRQTYIDAIAKESQFAPPAPATLTKYQDARAALLAANVPPTDRRVKELDAMILKETTHAPAAVVNVSQSTEKKFGEVFGTKVAERDVGLLDTATKAPDLAANANRVLGILSQGNVFTGTAADMKLNMARALNLAGADNNEKISNTELLLSGLARQTLGAVKTSGLGTGQGFTDKDLKFLQDVEGGRITMNAQTIQRLAELSHSAAEKSAATWNKRVNEIPKTALEGTGLSTEPIVVPKRFGVVATPAAPAVGAKSEGYRFKGGDPAVAANWEKL